MTTGSISTITPADAKTKIDAGEAVVVDVRPAFDWAGGRIPGSINLPKVSIKFRRAEVPEGKEIIFVGISTAKSIEGAEAATALGFPSVYVIEGDGYDEWLAAGLPSETIDG